VAMGGSLARWILLVTAAALVLLVRPLDQPVAARGGDERASCSTGDDLVLSSGRRSTPSIRMGEARTDEGPWSIDLGPGYENVVLAGLVSDLVFAAARRYTPRFEHPTALSARGPPSSRA